MSQNPTIGSDSQKQPEYPQEGLSGVYKVDNDFKTSLYLSGRNKVIFWHVFCYCVVANINLRVVTMHHNKDTQKEIIIIEAAVWAFWVFVFSVGYLLAKVTF